MYFKFRLRPQFFGCRATILISGVYLIKRYSWDLSTSCYRNCRMNRTLCLDARMKGTTKTQKPMKKVMFLALVAAMMLTGACKKTEQAAAGSSEVKNSTVDSTGGGGVLPGDTTGGGGILPGDSTGGGVLPGDSTGGGGIFPGDTVG